MLHLTNGGTTAALVREAGLPGEAFSVDDILMEGPLRHGLREAPDVTHRAAWLAGRLGIPKGEYLATWARRERLARLAGRREDRVVLWSEDDLFCHLNLAHFATLLRTAPPRDLLLVVPPEGQRLGTLPAARMGSLLDAGTPVDDAFLAAAVDVFEAVAGDDPRAVLALATRPPAAWPAVGPSLLLHLARLPEARSGLGLVEATLARLLADRPDDLAGVFARFSAHPATRDLGAGDVQVLGALRAMAAGPHPLVHVDDPRALDDPASGGRWGVTPLAKDALEGREDATAIRGQDGWWGGVRLEGTRVWRWEGSSRALRSP